VASNVLEKPEFLPSRLIELDEGIDAIKGAPGPGTDEGAYNDVLS
jgi:hypothetical protein